MRVFTAIGMMSGTSMDGIDVALIRSDGETYLERGASCFFAYDESTKREIERALEEAKSLAHKDERTPRLKSTEGRLTDLHLSALGRFTASNKLEKSKIDFIGFHGQTILHRPEAGLTVQLGDAAGLARASGIPVIYDLRQNDMQHGGHGAPLAPAYHAVLATHLPGEFPRGATCFVNIGGISNVTYIGADNSELIAFDSGPGNNLLDQWMLKHFGREFDEDGAVSAAGTVDLAVIEEFLSHRYFDEKPPKSLDRSDFDLAAVSDLSPENGARTLCRIAAEGVFKAADHMPERPLKWIICGGGRKNPVIMGELQTLAESEGAVVLPVEAAGFDGDTVEAEAWAYLAIRSQLGLPITFPGTTGAEKPVSGGLRAEPQ